MESERERLGERVVEQDWILEIDEGAQDLHIVKNCGDSGQGSAEWKS